MSVITLESSYQNSNKKSNNNEWETTFKQDYIINEGDVVLLKNVFINDKSLSGSILIYEDTTIEIEFGYYYINGLQGVQYIPRPVYPYPNPILPTFNPNYELIWYDNTGKVLPNGPLQNNYIYSDEANIPNGVPAYYYQQEPATGWPQENFAYDFKAYVYHNYNPVNKYTLIKNKVSCVIEKGSYSPSALANLLTQKLSSVNGNMSINVFNKQLQSLPVNQNSLYSGSNLLVGIGSFTPNIQPSPQTGPDVIYANRFIGSYVNQYDGQGNLDLSGYEQFSIQPKPYQDLYIGASEFAIDYDEINQNFLFSYIHTPMYAGLDNNSGVPSVVFVRFATGDPSGQDVKFFLSDLFTQTKNSGIFITDLQPATFWENLGFNLPDIIVNTTNGVDIGEVLTKTTDQQMPLSSVFAGSQFTNAFASNQAVRTGLVNTGLVTNDPQGAPFNSFNAGYINFIDSTNNLPIQATNAYQSQDAGFYYISCDIGLGSLSDDGKSQTKEIMGIVSKQFNVNDFITGFSDSSITYQHNGPPTMLNNLKIKILDKNKNLVKNLDENSCAFIQIIKQVQPIITNPGLPSNK
jgi:hypothetical protein